jgi:hypothetical protein
MAFLAPPMFSAALFYAWRLFATSRLDSALEAFQIAQFRLRREGLKFKNDLM